MNNFNAREIFLLVKSMQMIHGHGESIRKNCEQLF